MMAIMILQFSIGEGDILEYQGQVLIFEIANKQGKYMQIINQNYEKRNKNLTEFIYVYANKKNKNRNIMLAVLTENLDMNSYCITITAILDSIYEKSGKNFSVYLPSVSNFNDLGAAVSKFCEKHIDYNFFLTFFTEPENLQCLNHHMDRLQQMINFRKEEISSELFDKFRCFCCRNFAYIPSIFPCCNLIVCSRCSRLKFCPGCKNPKNAEAQNHLINVFSSLPYYCYCGTRMIFSQKREHSQICEIRWFSCKICNQTTTYLDSINHIRNHHVEHVYMDNIF